MIGFLGKIVGRVFSGVVRAVVLGLVLMLGLVVALYGWQAHRKLERLLLTDYAGKGTTTWYETVARSKALVETRFPVTVRAYVKDTLAHNWVPVEGHGLVQAVLQWSPGQNQWVEEPREGLPFQSELRAKAITHNPLMGKVIEDLNDDDPIIREVAFRELKIRTGKDFGYRPLGAPDERARAVSEWEAWWVENKLKWTAGTVLDKVRKVLE